jgi:DNA polymerase-4
MTIAHYTADAAEIRRIAGQCLKRAPLQRRLRLLGVKVGALAALDPSHTASEKREATPETGWLFD